MHFTMWIPLRHGARSASGTLDQATLRTQKSAEMTKAPEGHPPTSGGSDLANLLSQLSQHQTYCSGSLPGLLPSYP